MLSSSSTALLSVVLTLLTSVSAGPHPKANPIPQSQPTDVPTSIVSAPAPTVTSTTLSTIPQCAQSCLTKATLSQPCTSTDTQCLCAHSSQIESLVLGCLASSSCSKEEIESTANYYENLCVGLGYPLTALPTASIISATGAPPTVASGGVGVASSSSSSSPSFSSTTSQGSSDSNSSLKISIIVGLAAGGALILALTLTTCFVIFRRRRRAQREAQSDNNKERKSSKGSIVSTAINSPSTRSNTLQSQKSFDGPSRKSTIDTFFTMVRLSDIEKDRQHQHNKSSSVSDYSNYSNNTTSTTKPPQMNILTEKELPDEPKRWEQLSPALAAFDFGIGARDSSVGVARGSGMELFMGPMPNDGNVDSRGHWGHAPVENGSHFV